MGDKNHQYAHLKKLLEGGDNYFWPQKEKDLFIKLVKKYGKNYPLIAAKLKTKTIRQISRYSYNLYTRIEKNPRHIHKALKEKLKPKIIVLWTTREYNLLLRGLKENMKYGHWIKRAQAKLKNKNR